MKAEVLILGAGIVGISAALHLQSRGCAVVLVDRRGPGEEASYGNLGLIERGALFPPAFPRGLNDLLRYAANRAPEARYHLAELIKIAPSLFLYWHHSAPVRYAKAVVRARPLIERSVAEHEALATCAGTTALLGRQGFLKLCRSERSLEALAADAKRLMEYGIRCQMLSSADVHAAEPDLARVFVGGVRYCDAVPVSDPGALTKSYAALFAKRGGEIARGDAMSLRQDGRAWEVETEVGPVRAERAVVSLGAWSGRVMRRFGYRIPLIIKRGYHRSFALRDGASLRHPVADEERGYAVAPIAGRVRVSSGIEFGSVRSPPTPRQIFGASDVAKSILPLGEPVESTPWMGFRPCMPDMLPVIGCAGRHDRLWFSFGHGHHGFTLGPVTGRLLAEMMTGEAPFTDPEPYRPTRFS